MKNELLISKDARDLREMYERINGEHLDPDYAPPIDHQETRNEIGKMWTGIIGDSMKKWRKEIREGKQTGFKGMLQDID